MLASHAVTLQPATVADAALLANLLELYVHDLSEVFPVEIGSNGRFGYAKLSLYWSEPSTHWAFLIRSGLQIAGFALVTRGSPATTDPHDLDLAEFFVLRSYRRSGVGCSAAFALWDRLPGRWIVRVSEAHRTGLLFWERVIETYTHGTPSRTAHPGKHHMFRVFSFRSDASSAAV
jgi:predicted acetyltransferase